MEGSWRSIHDGPGNGAPESAREQTLAAADVEGRPRVRGHRPGYPFGGSGCYSTRRT